MLFAIDCDSGRLGSVALPCSPVAEQVMPLFLHIVRGSLIPYLHYQALLHLGDLPPLEEGALHGAREDLMS